MLKLSGNFKPTTDVIGVAVRRANNSRIKPIATMFKPP